MGKIPPGIFDGNIHWVGQFEECENIAINGSTSSEYKGKYSYNEILITGVSTIK